MPKVVEFPREDKRAEDLANDIERVIDNFVEQYPDLTLSFVNGVMVTLMLNYFCNAYFNAE